jgi:hypothetical protein
MSDYQPVSTASGLANNEKLQMIRSQTEAQFNATTRRFGGKWKLLFFTCAACTTAAGIMSLIVGVMTFAAPFDYINFVFLTLFGLVMLVVDVPLDNMYIRNFRYAIFHYALFMTRFIGRGLWYIFLGSMVFGALYDNGICPSLGFILGAYMCVVAVCSLQFGLRLTNSLEEVRTKVVEQGPEKWGAYIPPRGMTKTQFKDMAVALKGTVFSEEELDYIVQAFSFEVKADDIISRDEFEEWCRGPSATLL